MNKTIRAGIAALAVAGALTLAGCGTTTTSSDTNVTQEHAGKSLVGPQEKGEHQRIIKQGKGFGGQCIWVVPNCFSGQLCIPYYKCP